MDMATKPTTKNSKSKTPNAKPPSPKPRGIVPSESRTRWAKPVSQSVDRLTKGLLGKHGFTHAAVVTKWPEIVGEAMARHTQPEKIVFSRDGATGGTLHLKTDSGAFATQLMHIEPQVIERINTFFGYRAVVRLKIIQGPLSRPRHANRQTTPPRPLSAAEARDLAGTIATVDDPELKEALERLGEKVMGRQKDKDQS